MAKKITINIDGFGIGAKSGMSKATSQLKKKSDGTIAICSFYNGYATFIKDKGEVRPITDEEINLENLK